VERDKRARAAATIGIEEIIESVNVRTFRSKIIITARYYTVERERNLM
jgi:hypothetical protein